MHVQAPPGGYKVAYRREYLVQREALRRETMIRENLRRRQPRHPMPPFPGHRPMFPAGPGFRIPGAIGGDYDRLPPGFVAGGMGNGLGTGFGRLPHNGRGPGSLY